MARGINKVILIGNLGADPDTRFSAQGSAITNLNLATDESYKDKQTGQVVPKTEWHRIVLFNRLAEIAKDYLKKGSKVYIEGRLQTRKWKDQSGQDRYTTEIVGNELQMLDTRPHGDTPGSGHQQQSGGGYSPPAPQNASAPAPGLNQNGTHISPSAPAPAPMDDFDDDIPF